MARRSERHASAATKNSTNFACPSRAKGSSERSLAVQRARARAKKERAKVKEDQVVLLEPGLPLSRQLVERRSKSRKNHKKRLKRKKQPVLLKKSVLKKSKMPTKTRKRPKQGL
jgi:hypothetical protein